MSQLMFLAGVSLTIGPQATLRFFMRRKNLKARTALRGVSAGPSATKLGGAMSTCSRASQQCSATMSLSVSAGPLADSQCVTRSGTP